MFDYYSSNQTYPAIQVQCAVKTTPDFFSVATHALCGELVTLCEGFTLALSKHTSLLDSTEQ